ncbi:uncharacterized protein LOC122508075 [Leptopilina heterotoma]|uniref:uncharacterized protein LOC122508075 n=1 Tax=Leptopilina heterotoma TaxID=63436 RepID=UPI001CAA20FB|nr:uncharacterized protein LOC122508075 [Leptopilina heterotoma]
MEFIDISHLLLHRTSQLLSGFLAENSEKMSFLMRNIQLISKLYRNGCIQPVMSVRNLSRAPVLLQTAEEVQEKSEISTQEQLINEDKFKKQEKSGGFINLDRTVEIPVETSIKYIESEAYKTTYGDNPIWKLYRRNFKGQFAPRKTRKTCIRGGVVSTGNPCPICRDEYLVLDYKNRKLLNQFISPYNGETLSYRVTNICQKQHKNLLVAIKIAKDRGIVTYDPPHRKYNYSHWYKPESTQI